MTRMTDEELARMASWSGGYADLARELLTARRLAEFAGHKRGCGRISAFNEGKPCTCGFDQARFEYNRSTKCQECGGLVYRGDLCCPVCSPEALEDAKRREAT